METEAEGWSEAKSLRKQSTWENSTLPCFTACKSHLEKIMYLSSCPLWFIERQSCNKGLGLFFNGPAMFRSSDLQCPCVYLSQRFLWVITIYFQPGDICVLSNSTKGGTLEGKKEHRFWSLDLKDTNFSPLLLNLGNSFQFFKFQLSCQMRMVIQTTIFWWGFNERDCNNF